MLYQFCTSGGHFKFLNDPLFEAHFDVRSMPLFTIATSKYDGLSLDLHSCPQPWVCREQQFSLGYTFTGLFLHKLSEAMKSGGETTLLELYKATEEQYWLDHVLEKQMNEQNVKEGRASQVLNVYTRRGPDPLLPGVCRTCSQLWTSQRYSVFKCV